MLLLYDWVVLFEFLFTSFIGLQGRISVFKYTEDLFQVVDVTMICSPIKMTFADDMRHCVASLHLSMKTHWSFHHSHPGNPVTRGSNVISHNTNARICISASLRWTESLIQSRVKEKQLLQNDLSLYWLNEIIQILKSAFSFSIRISSRHTLVLYLYLKHTHTHTHTHTK